MKATAVGFLGHQLSQLERTGIRFSKGNVGFFEENQSLLWSRDRYTGSHILKPLSGNSNEPVPFKMWVMSR